MLLHRAAQYIIVSLPRYEYGQYAYRKAIDINGTNFPDASSPVSQQQVQLSQWTHTFVLALNVHQEQPITNLISCLLRLTAEANQSQMSLERGRKHAAKHNHWQHTHSQCRGLKRGEKWWRRQRQSLGLVLKNKSTSAVGIYFRSQKGRCTIKIKTRVALNL